MTLFSSLQFKSIDLLVKLKMIKLKIFNLIILGSFIQSIVCLNLCGDWTQYKDIKCLKVLNKSGTQDEALHNCTQLDQSSTLPTIHSKDEQQFITNLLQKYQNISINAWIGMKYTDQVYKWMDGTETNFYNWANDAVRDGTAQCVQMSLYDKTIGKWTDESCKKTALIVCQKKQELNFNVVLNLVQKMENSIEIMKKQLEGQKNITDKEFEQLKNMNENQKKLIEAQNEKFNSISSVPLGFLYTQFPSQSKPEDLWPNTKWSEITSQYSGLFFRAEGGNSAPFGQTQQANQSSISNAYYWGFKYDSFGIGHSYTKETYLNQNQWAEIESGGATAVYLLKFFTTDGEVRPKNTAIKIWKRIQ